MNSQQIQTNIDLTHNMLSQTSLIDIVTKKKFLLH